RVQQTEISSTNVIDQSAMSVIESKVGDDQISFRDIHCAGTPSEIKNEVLDIQRWLIQRDRLAVKVSVNQRWLAKTRGIHDSGQRWEVRRPCNAQFSCTNLGALPRCTRLGIVLPRKINEFGKCVELTRINIP